MPRFAILAGLVGDALAERLIGSGRSSADLVVAEVRAARAARRAGERSEGRSEELGGG